MPFSCPLLKRNNYQKYGYKATLLKQAHGALLAPLSQSQGLLALLLQKNALILKEIRENHRNRLFECKKNGLFYTNMPQREKLYSSYKNFYDTLV